MNILAELTTRQRLEKYLVEHPNGRINTAKLGRSFSITRQQICYLLDKLGEQRHHRLPSIANCCKACGIDISKNATYCRSHAKIVKRFPGKYYQCIACKTYKVLEEFANAIKSSNLEYFVEILDIPLTNTFDAGGISTAQRYIKSWIANVNEEIIIPMQHFKVMYDVLTDSRKVLSIRDFTKAMNRLSVVTVRKRMGEGEYQSAPRGVLVTWLLDKGVKESLLKIHFDSKDMSLIQTISS